MNEILNDIFITDCLRSSSKWQLLVQVEIRCQNFECLNVSYMYHPSLMFWSNDAWHWWQVLAFWINDIHITRLHCRIYSSMSVLFCLVLGNKWQDHSTSQSSLKEMQYQLFCVGKSVLFAVSSCWLAVQTTTKRPNQCPISQITFHQIFKVDGNTFLLL